jgi:predicted ATP-dependent endonuclease of OLD family
MKISKLYIDQFRHLENLDFDFTYQSGDHKGQPLDKICFIGQSATGKTGLLELIYKESLRLQNAVRFEELTEHIKPNHSNSDCIPSGLINFISGTINRSFIIGKTNTEPVFYEFQKDEVLSNWETEQLIAPKQNENAFYFKANLISDKNIDIFTKNPIDLFEKYQEKIQLVDTLFVGQEDFNSSFDENVEPEMWLFLLQEILRYRKNFTQKMSELIHKGLLADTKKLDIEYKKWQKENPNELEDFAKKFNPLLEKLNLEIDLVNTEYSIPIKNKKTEEIIPIQNTSTGTKGLLLSFLPLFKLDTKDSIILIDEPERSLYPDMQMELMDHYQRLAPDAQFIVATHSPFIAASFEAEERFILYFDEEGKVAVRRGSSPIGDDPNDMLYNDFGINYINKFGQAKYDEYLSLKQKIHFEKDENIKKEYAEKLEKIGDEYNF